MGQYDWNNEKNQELKRTRNVSFEQVILHIEQGDLLDILEHPNPHRYPNQRVLVVKIMDYVHAVPFVEQGQIRFLKTIIPSRKLTRDYLSTNPTDHYPIDDEPETDDEST